MIPPHRAKKQPPNTSAGKKKETTSIITVEKMIPPPTTQQKGKEKELKYKAGIKPLIEMGFYFHEMLPLQPKLLEAVQECPFWGLIKPFFKEQPEIWTSAESNIESNVLTKNPQAIELILDCYNIKPSKKKPNKAFYFGGKSYLPTAMDFSVVFGIQRVEESPDLKKKLSKLKDTHVKFLHQHFPPDPTKKDYKVARQKIEARMIKAIEDKEPAEYFLVFLGMWLCALFFFTDGSGNNFSHKWLPHIFMMHRVSWPELIIDFLMKNIENPRGKKGLKSVAGCTPFLLYWVLEHSNYYNTKREDFKNSTPRFIRWNQLDFCTKMVKDNNDYNKDKTNKKSWSEEPFDENFLEALTEIEIMWSTMKKVKDELAIEKALNKLLQQQLDEQKEENFYLENENVTINKVHQRRTPSDGFLNKFVRDVKILRRIVEGKFLTDEEKEQVALVDKHLQEWKDAKIEEEKDEEDTEVDEASNIKEATKGLSVIIDKITESTVVKKDENIIKQVEEVEKKNVQEEEKKKDLLYYTPKRKLIVKKKLVNKQKSETTPSFGAVMVAVDEAMSEFGVSQTPIEESSKFSNVAEALVFLYGDQCMDVSTQDEDTEEHKLEVDDSYAEEIEDEEEMEDEGRDDEMNSIVRGVKNVPRKRKKKELSDDFTNDGKPKNKRVKIDCKDKGKDDIIDVENIVSIVKPPETEELIKPEKLKLWSLCSDEEKKMIGPFFENEKLSTGASTVHWKTRGEDVQFNINGYHLQNLMNNLNISGEIIDFYCNHLKGKVGKVRKNGLIYRNHLILTTNDFPYLRIALAKKDRSKIEGNETVMTIREQFQYHAIEMKKRFLLIPMCMNLDGKPHHWVLLTLENGIWGVYNSTANRAAYNMQIRAMTLPLTEVLNEMGHKDYNGGAIVPNFKNYISTPKQKDNPDCALYVCMCMKLLTKYGTLQDKIPTTEAEEGEMARRINLKRIKLTKSILSQGAWNLTTQREEEVNLGD